MQKCNENKISEHTFVVTISDMNTWNIGRLQRPTFAYSILRVEIHQEQLF